MPPEGILTPTQHEIMVVVWESGTVRTTVNEIWQAVSQARTVTRTTVLNLVSRIAKRGWLRRRRKRGKYHYAATVGHEVAAQLAGEFVQDFFEGSASELVMSLLGSDRLSVKEIERLRQLLKSRLPRSDKGKDTPP